MSTNRNPRLVLLSGRKAAGKDTLAPTLMAAFGHDNPRHLSFADPLKDEVDRFIHLCRQARNHREAEHLLETLHGVDPMTGAERATIVGFLYRTSKNPREHSRSHSPDVVRALQYYGTEVRRKSDPDYWVKKAVAAAEAALSAGDSVVFTDARFPNEVTGLQSIGGFAVRLEVSPEVQLERLKQRDGYVPQEAMMTHPSETALDGFTGFDVVVDTSDGDTPRMIDEILGAA